MKHNNKTKPSSPIHSIENLLFNGLVYRIISEPDGIRDSMHDLGAFLDTAKSIDVNSNIETIESAMQTIERIKDKDGAFTAFESFLENSRYSLIIVDQHFNHIFHNQKSKEIISQLFNNDNPKKLTLELIDKIFDAKKNHIEKKRRLIIISNAIHDRNAYLISNQHKSDNDRSFNIILLPDTDTHKFKLNEELISIYHFTNKETLILSNLIAGLGLQKISKELCISLNTVRSHLKSIFRKTETNSQSDLIRLFLQHESQFLGSYLEPFSQIDINDSQKKSTDLFITLSAGNKICYREYGPKDGRPLIIFHNLFGSRFHIPYRYSEILVNTNRRIIIPERPGYGLSDPFPNFNAQWSSMFNEFIEKLKIDSFDLLGNVSGSALAIDYASDYSDKLQTLILTSPLFINDDKQKKLLGDLPYNASRMISVSKYVAHNAFRLWMKSMKYDAERYIRKMIEQYAGHNEINSLDDQCYIDRITLNFSESQQNNSNGSAQDAVYTLTPLKLDLTKIDVPLSVWVGDEDSLISASSAQKICAPIPNKTFHIRKGFGEDIFYHLFEEIIQ